MVQCPTTMNKEGTLALWQVSLHQLSQEDLSNHYCKCVVNTMQGLLNGV